MATQKFARRIMVAGFFVSYFTLAACFSIAPAPAEKSDQLADEVCKNTKNYAFCEATIYSDPRAPTADRYVLAYIAYGKAYRNATDTRDYIDSLLKKANTGATQNQRLRDGLQKCRGYYEEAVGSLAEALGDLDSETFDLLEELAVDADDASQDCEAAFKGNSPLSKKNRDLSALAKICVVVSKLYTVS